ncbi:PEP/pyruvate-binding domain-containing protein [Rhodocyclaceae bacterium SMB388]
MDEFNLADEIFHFGAGAPTPTGSPDTLGFKAWNLARMAGAGMRVPPAFVLSTAWCRAWREQHHRASGLEAVLADHVRRLEQRTGRFFGGTRRPLLVSVRSGAPVSMPGMMETLLDIGLCDATADGLLRATGNPRLVWDSYRRLIKSYAEVVFALSPNAFEQLVEPHLAVAGVTTPAELDFHALREITRESLDLFRRLTGRDFPQSPKDQLLRATEAVFDSWESDKAASFRRLNDIPDDLGTAVTVQMMVFGNGGGTSGSGVAFTRDPATGEKRLYVDFQFNAQGEDVVSGRHALGEADLLAQRLPSVATEVQEVATLLEAEFGDMQEFEFTVEDGVLYLLQSRTGKRTPWAAVVIVVEQAKEGLITPGEAIARLDGIDAETVVRRRRATTPDQAPLARALSTGPGVVSGCIALSVERAREMHAAGQPVILVRDDIATGDIEGIAIADGIVTAMGGRTSHAAVVARQMNKVCLVGCSALQCDDQYARARFGGETLAEGDVITLDGDAGKVWSGEVSTIVERPDAWLAELRRWKSGDAVVTAASSRA